ncbi:glycerate kinase [Streptodolium elevatio]|uniref:Glycerate kinase n=1 Tax=Streptodolium elevatio TaxID=3157996 RepID=A0ABV3D9C1_9ACTN
MPNGTGVVELALVCGLPMLAAPDPLGAHTAGLGVVIADALRTGVSELAVAVGGSASTDGGTAALAALGARFLDTVGRELPYGGGALPALAAFDATGLTPPPPGGVQILTDVGNPLLGPQGAARVFGPQKGADSDDLAVLEAGLARLAAALGGDPTAPGTGAAGGTAYGFAAAWSATITSGAARIAELISLDVALADADLVVTGEGRFDATSLQGKVAGTVLGFAARQRHRTPVALVAGSVAAPLPVGVAAALSLTDLAGSPAAATADAAHWLHRAGRLLAARFTGVQEPRDPVKRRSSS